MDNYIKKFKTFPAVPLFDFLVAIFAHFQCCLSQGAKVLQNMIHKVYTKYEIMYVKENVRGKKSLDKHTILLNM